MERRRQARRANAVGHRMAAWARDLRQVSLRLAGSPRVRRGVPALLVMLGIGLLFGARPTPAGGAPSGMPAHVEGPPTIARWVDRHGDPKLNVLGTAYTLWMRGDQTHTPGTFIFTITGTIALGDRGSAVPAEVQVSGFAELSPLTGGAYTQNACAFGQALLAAPAAAQGRAVGAKGSPAASVVVFRLRARIAQNGLVAYAVLDVLQGPVSGLELNASVCDHLVASKQLVATRFQMVSGCEPANDPASDPASATCSDPVNDPATGIVHTVNTYADALKSGNLGQVYAMTSQLVAGQYTAAEFAEQLRGEFSRVGKITGISHITTPPDVRFDAAGQAYFKVSQTVTLDRNNQTQTVNSYYLFEDGAWKFWFSCDPKDTNVKC